MKTDLLDEFRNKLQAGLQAMPPVARWTAVAVIIAALAGLVIALQSDTPTPDTYLFIAEIPEEDLSAMRSAFARAGLASYVVDDGRIRVPHREQNLYFRTLEEANALPREFGDLLSGALDEGGPWETREQKAERMKNARQRELARIIGMMTGIERATVLYDEQLGRGLRARPTVSASVAVKAAANLDLASNQVVTIRNLLAGAVAGLAPMDVAVSCLNSGRTYVAGQGAEEELIKQPKGYADHKAIFEQQWRRKIEDSLHWVSGLQVTVDVTLERAARGAEDRPVEQEWTPDQVQVALGVPKTYVKEVWLARSGIPADRAPQFRPQPQQLAALQAEIEAELRKHVGSLIPRSSAATSPLDIQLTFFDQIERGPTAPLAVARPVSVPVQLKWPIMILFGLVAAGVAAIFWSKRSTATNGRDAELERNAETIDDPQQPIDEVQISGDSNTGHGESAPGTIAPRAESGLATQRVADFVKSEPKPERLIPRGYVPGLELNDWTGFQMTTDDQSPAAAPVADATAKRKKRLKLLEDIEASDLAQMLSDESAQVVAVVFSHLDARQAADVLKELPPALRLEVVRRLSNLDHMTDEVMQEIEDGLHLRLADQIHRTRRRNAGIRAVSSILDAASGELKNDILGQLRREDVALSRKLQGNAPPPEIRVADKLASAKQPLDKQPAITPRRRDSPKGSRTPEPVITFEDVIHLDDDTLRTVLGAADPQVAILALAGATHEVVDRLIQSMKPQEAERLRGALTNLGPTRLRDVEASQNNLVQVASSLDADGRINLQAKRPLRLSA